MGGLWDELGRKLADRWLTLLVLPGALYLAVAIAAHILGQSHALDIHQLTGQVTTWARAPAASTVGGQVVLLAAAVAVSAAAGLAAQGLGSVIERLALAAGWHAWPSPLCHLAASRVTRRRHRWDKAHAAYHRDYELARQARIAGDRLDPAERHKAYRARTRIAAERPDRPTWSGDRIHAVNVRLDRDCHLDLATVWPYLWLTVPEPVRAEITTARQALTRATTLGGWALLHAPLTAWWWPAVLITAVVAVTAWQRTRTTADTYALLLETAARLHTGDLARHLGIDHTGLLTPDVGEALTHLLHTQPPPPPAAG